MSEVMKVLVVYGSKMGGTEGLAQMVGDALVARGFDADVRSATERTDVADYDAVVVGGALYAFRWHRAARRFVRRNRRELAAKPVWLFSSGPLDDSAVSGEIPPVRGVGKMMARIGARGHMTFGGRMPADAKGFPAGAMARDNAGDWRDPDHVGSWVDQIVGALASNGRRPTGRR